MQEIVYWFDFSLQCGVFRVFSVFFWVFLGNGYDISNKKIFIFVFPLCKCILLAFFSTFLFDIAAVNSIILLPYGVGAGDQNHTSGDDEDITIKTSAIKIGSKFYDTFLVSVWVSFLFAVGGEPDGYLGPCQTSMMDKVFIHICLTGS